MFNRRGFLGRLLSGVGTFFGLWCVSDKLSLSNRQPVNQVLSIDCYDTANIDQDGYHRLRRRGTFVIRRDADLNQVCTELRKYNQLEFPIGYAITSASYSINNIGTVWTFDIKGEEVQRKI